MRTTSPIPQRGIRALWEFASTVRASPPAWLSLDYDVNRIDGMQDFHAFKSSAVRYWERRRLVYNAALVLPALLGYMLTAGFVYVGDPHPTLYRLVLVWFSLSAIGANVCYSFAYALEFLFGSDEPASRWLRFDRTTAFVGGLLFAMVLAFFGGRNIAMMEFYENVKHAG